MYTKGEFENFLIEKHAEQYLGTDDNMPDDFSNWLVDLDIEYWLDFGDEFAQQSINKAKGK